MDNFKVLRSTSVLAHQTPAQAAETGILSLLPTYRLPWPNSQLNSAAFLPLDLAVFIRGMGNADKLQQIKIGRVCFQANVERVFQQLHPNEQGTIKTAVVGALSLSGTLTKFAFRSRELGQILDFSSNLYQDFRLLPLTDPNDRVGIFYLVIAKVNKDDPIAVEDWLRGLLHPLINKGVETCHRAAYESGFTNVVIPESSDPCALALGEYKRHGLDRFDAQAATSTTSPSHNHPAFANISYGCIRAQSSPGRVRYTPIGRPPITPSRNRIRATQNVAATRATINGVAVYVPTTPSPSKTYHYSNTPSWE